MLCVFTILCMARALCVMIVVSCASCVSNVMRIYACVPLCVVCVLLLCGVMRGTRVLCVLCVLYVWCLPLVCFTYVCAFVRRAWGCHGCGACERVCVCVCVCVCAYVLEMLTYVLERQIV